ncbi:CBN-ASP-1 protein, partial [Aphelenchoides avenae]
LLVLAAVVAVACSRSIVQRIERHKAPSLKSLGGGQRAGRLPARGHRSSRLDVGSQPLIDYYDDYYIGNVTVGDGTDPFTVVMDTGSSNLWVIDCACRQQACKGYPDSGYKKHCYNPNASAEYVANGKPFSIQYGEGDVSGYLGADFVTFAGRLFDVKPTFGIATTVSDDFGYKPFDGIFGLGWPSISDDQVQPILFEILYELDQPLFSIYLERHVKLSSAAPGGFITYGAVDTEHCDAQINYVPLTQEGWWQFEWDG